MATNNNPDGATFAEAPASVNFKFYYQGYDVMLTLRGLSGSEVLGKLDAAIAHLATLDAAPTGGRPDGLPPMPAPGEEGSFIAETLAVSVDEDGKTHSKVRGGKFTKFGVRIWPEVLAAAGIDPVSLQPGQHDMTGMTAYFAVKEDGKASKVTRLVRGDNDAGLPAPPPPAEEKRFEQKLDRQPKSNGQKTYTAKEKFVGRLKKEFDTTAEEIGKILLGKYAEFDAQKFDEQYNYVAKILSGEVETDEIPF